MVASRNIGEYLKFLNPKLFFRVHHIFVVNMNAIKKFNINFLRSHMKVPELRLDIKSVNQIVQAQRHFRMPSYVIGRKQGKFWKITEKIFAEEF